MGVPHKIKDPAIRKIPKWDIVQDNQFSLFVSQCWGRVGENHSRLRDLRDVTELKQNSLQDP